MPPEPPAPRPQAAPEGPHHPDPRVLSDADAALLARLRQSRRRPDPVPRRRADRDDPSRRAFLRTLAACALGAGVIWVWAEARPMPDFSRDTAVAEPPAPPQAAAPGKPDKAYREMTDRYRLDPARKKDALAIAEQGFMLK